MGTVESFGAKSPSSCGPCGPWGRIGEFCPGGRVLRPASRLARRRRRCPPRWPHAMPAAETVCLSFTCLGCPFSDPREVNTCGLNGKVPLNTKRLKEWLGATKQLVSANLKYKFVQATLWPWFLSRPLHLQCGAKSGRFVSTPRTCPAQKGTFMDVAAFEAHKPMIQTLGIWDQPDLHSEAVNPNPCAVAASS